MKPRDLDSLFELWARWVRDGCNSRGSFASMLEMMMVTRGQFSAGGAPNDALETRIEGAVALLAQIDTTAAFVVRIEYGAWEIRDLDRDSPQIEKAHAISMTLRTYVRKLAKARLFVAGYLKDHNV